MKIIIAPDSFKGSLTAVEAADAMAAGARKAAPDAEIVTIPLADGGEGTVDAWIRSGTGRRRCVIQVTGPLGEPVEAAYGFDDPTGIAVVESASACGLTLVPAELRDPLNTTTYGVGELIADALNHNCKRLIVGLGGTSTNDGGAGALQALGVRFLDDSGNALAIPMTGGRLHQICVVDGANSAAPCEVILASDVTNPLTGPNGASMVYGPQKGATPEMAAYLDAALGRLSILYENHFGCRGLSDTPGAGAAGGLGAALLALFGAAVRSGIDLILDDAGFNAHLHDADIVITGEGAIDRQTLNGKTVAGVLARCLRQPRIRVIAIGGIVQPDAVEVLRSRGLFSAVAASPPEMHPSEAMAHAGELVVTASEKAVRGVLVAWMLGDRCGS